MKAHLKLLSLLVPVLVAIPYAASANGSDGMNIRFSPLGLIVGSFDLTLDVPVSTNWTLGPQLSYTHLSLGTNDTGFSIKGYSAGLRANWFNNGVFSSGLYVGPSLVYDDLTVTYRQSDGTSGDAKTSGLGAAVLVGYGWFWDSFNIMLGGGLQTHFQNASVTVTNPDGSQHTNSNLGTGLTGEFSLGWTF